MDEQRPADGSPTPDDERPGPVDAGADGPPPPPVPPAGAPPAASPGTASGPAGPPSAPPGTASGAPPGTPPGAPPGAAPGTPPGAAPAAPRRSRWPLLVALVAVVVGVPIALVLLSGSGDDEGPVAAQGDESEDDAGASDGAEEGPDEDDEPTGEGEGAGDGPSEPGAEDGAPGDEDGAPGDEDGAPGGVDPDAELEPLDLTALEGVDRTYGELLTDIDASERTMIDFQAGLADAFSGAATPEDALDGAGAVAAESRQALLAVRELLTTPLDDPGADRVRDLYVAHLDAWEGFMAAVEEDPLAAFEQGESGSTVRINATADAFARALEAELPDDIDAEVERYAEQLLDRGFRDMGYADV